MFYKANIHVVQGVFQYPFDISLIKNPMYSQDMSLILFESDSQLEVNADVQSIDESDFTSFENSLPTPQEDDHRELTEIDVMKEENESLKLRLAQTERLVAETNLTQQQLIELLIDMEVI